MEFADSDLSCYNESLEAISSSYISPPDLPDGQNNMENASSKDLKPKCNPARRHSYPIMEREDKMLFGREYFINNERTTDYGASESPGREWPLFVGIALVSLSTSCFDLLGPSLFVSDSRTGSLLLSCSFLTSAILCFAFRYVNRSLIPWFFLGSGALFIPFIRLHLSPSLENLLPSYSILGSWIFASLETAFPEMALDFSSLSTSKLGLGSGLSGFFVLLSLGLARDLPSVNVTREEIERTWWKKTLPIRLRKEESSILCSLLILTSIFGTVLVCLVYFRRHRRPDCGNKWCSLTKPPNKAFSLQEKSICAGLLSLGGIAGFQRAFIAQTFLEEIVLSNFGLPETCISVIIFGTSAAINSWLVKHTLKYFSITLVILVTSSFQYALLYVTWKQMGDNFVQDDVMVQYALSFVWGSVSSIIEFLILNVIPKDPSLFPVRSEVNFYRFLAGSLMFSSKTLFHPRIKILFLSVFYTIFVMTLKPLLCNINFK